MSDRMMQKRKHAEQDTSNVTLASGEKQIDDEAANPTKSDTNHVDKNGKMIYDGDFSKVSVDHLESMLVPLPGQGQKLLEKKCTDI